MKITEELWKDLKKMKVKKIKCKSSFFSEEIEIEF